jgi:hypothetical protein
MPRSSDTVEQWADSPPPCSRGPAQRDARVSGTAELFLGDQSLPIPGVGLGFALHDVLELELILRSILTMSTFEIGPRVDPELNTAQSCPVRGAC